MTERKNLKIDVEMYERLRKEKHEYETWNALFDRLLRNNKPMNDEKQIETGLEQDSDVTEQDADIFAYADNGEHATVWEVDRLSDTIVRVNYYRCEAGLSDHDGEEKFKIEPDTTTEEFARRLANADPEAAIELAEDYFN